MLQEEEEEEEQEGENEGQEEEEEEGEAMVGVEDWWNPDKRVLYDCEAGSLGSLDRKYPVRRLRVTEQVVKDLSVGGFHPQEYGIYGDTGEVKG